MFANILDASSKSEGISNADDFWKVATFRVVIKQRSLCFEERTGWKKGFQLRQGLIRVISRLVQLLTAVDVKYKSHDVLGKQIDNVFQLFS